jgi:hypothetical protein
MGRKATNGYRGATVVPDWLDVNMFSQILYDVRKNPEYTDLGQVEYKVPQFGWGMKSRNPHNAGPTIEELAEEYGDKAIRKARRIAKKSGASFAFLFTKRGFGELEITASLFRKNTTSEMGCEEEP